MNIRKNLIAGSVSFLMTLLTAFPAAADDTEAYVTYVPNSTPNILLLIDTSGSMSSDVYNKASDVDPATGYLKDLTPIPSSLASSGVSYHKLQGAYSISKMNNLRGIGPALSIWNFGSSNLTLDAVALYIGYSVRYYSYYVGTTAINQMKSDGILNSNNHVVKSALESFLNNNIGVDAYTITRIDMVKDVITDLMLRTDNVNFSLMRYSSDANGGMVTKAFSKVNNTDTAGIAARDSFINTIQGYSANGNTPLEETFFESSLYFRGLAPRYGLSSSPSHSVADSMSGGKYISPITNSCQKNSVVLFTDGQPTSDTNANTPIQNLVKGKTLPSGLSSNCSGNGQCMPELAWYLNNNDISSTIALSQTVSTYAIGFGIDGTDSTSVAARNLLNETAVQGGTNAALFPTNAAALKTAFSNIVQDVVRSATSFAAPTVSINAFNRLENDNQVYFTMFKPSVKQKWLGNLKKFLINSNGTIMDAAGQTAIDADTGNFWNGETGTDPITGQSKTYTTKSYWSSTADGNDVTKGGAAEQLPSPRNLYTYTGSYPISSAVDLTTSTNALSTANSLLTNTLLGDINLTSSDVSSLLTWATGYDSNGNPNHFLSDPLHSQPVVINYSKSTTGGVNTTTSTLFYGDNMGFLHAIDTSNGQEKFAFIPKELLPNIESYYNNGVVSQKTYGLDGAITAWVQDNNNDGNISAAKNDHVYLYVGMRRGGRNYYALDVTDPSSPKLKWVIRGGQGSFSELGQTWSKPQLATIKVAGTKTEVLVFAGGYDTNEDPSTTSTATDSMGRAIYIVNASTGALIWSAGPNSNNTLTMSNMNYSFPADITVGDLSGDGLTDIIYATDVRGHVFRFDINNKAKTTSGLMSGGMVADFSNSSSAHPRHFYNKPDAAVISLGGGSALLKVSLGSGYRAHPLEQGTTDRMYSFNDPNPYSAPTATTDPYKYASTTDPTTNKTTKHIITETDLYDATQNLVQSGSTSTIKNNAKNALATSNGWYISMDSNIYEKIITNSITLNNVLIFSSYAPPNRTGTLSCDPNAASNVGTSYVWAINLLNGAAVTNLDTTNNTGVLSTSDRKQALQLGGIATNPATIYTSKTTTKTDANGNTTKNTTITRDVYIARQKILLPDSALVTKTNWREND
jgi:type IV pilus assembly protein PilY1